MWRLFAWVVTVAVVGFTAARVPPREKGLPPGECVLFAPSVRPLAIVVPVDASAEERAAAELLRGSFAKAAGRPETDFPILSEREGPRQAIFVGATRRGGDFLRASAKPPFDTAVGVRVRDGSVWIRSERRAAIPSAVGWFLERKLGARAFMPGPLGEAVARRDELILSVGDDISRPGYVSRDLGTDGSAEAREWYRLNRLEPRFEHGHALSNLFRPEDYRRQPEMAPMRGGKRYLPASPADANLQPNLLSPAAVQHAANAAIRAFDADPSRVSFSLSENDAIRFDDSAATLAAVAPARFFRHRPDYSDLVFGFTNAVARLVAKRHPDRWLPAYAYYWTENTPRFRLEPNVVPFLTADRSRWSFPEFAAEDRALIERWCRSGAGLVGVYDYYEGAPFLVPRPMLYAIKESIPFAYKAGVRAFYGEGMPNWALDGPKSWLAAQLLWAPERNPDELLDIYYREFWAEAAAPMRRYFELCENVWQHQPGPPLWLRYYQDDDQSHIFSAEQRAALRAQIDAAREVAHSDAVRARVSFVSAGFSVTEAFADFCAKREALSRLVQHSAPPEEVLSSWRAYRHARGKFVRRFNDVRREQPLAIAPQDISFYLRNQPDSRAARELTRVPAGQMLLREAAYMPWAYIGAPGDQIAAVTSLGQESLQDPGWQSVVMKPVGGSATIEWTEAVGAWRGSGEPWEGRTVEMNTRPDGRRVLRFASCRTEAIGQWVTVAPNALYAAQVNVRAKVSPGTATFLVVTFLDEKQRHIGIGTIDRLPPDAGVQETELCVVAKPPPNARFIGFGVRVLNQVNDDFAEFSEPTLRRISL